jgi:hypothetical protein
MGHASWSDRGSELDFSWYSSKRSSGAENIAAGDLTPRLTPVMRFVPTGAQIMPRGEKIFTADELVALFRPMSCPLALAMWLLELALLGKWIQRGGGKSAGKV